MEGSLSFATAMIATAHYRTAGDLIIEGYDPKQYDAAGWTNPSILLGVTRPACGEADIQFTV
jgi:hypothetical protein